ncbi:MAG: hypothetical protein K0R59_107 [Sphingobacterium sp.]|jgi:hypothetical protein|nr:hypothetical protein [Sphingobacterium sp.]
MIIDSANAPMELIGMENFGYLLDIIYNFYIFFRDNWDARPSYK